MEGLIILIGSLFVGLIVVAAGMASGVLSLLLLPFEFLFGRKRTPKTVAPVQDEPVQDSRPKRESLKLPRWWPKLRNGIFITVGSLLLILVVFNLFFFESTVNFFAKSALESKGIEFKNNGIRGNLFTGRFEIDEVEISAKDWNVTVDELRVNASISSLMVGERSLEELVVSGFQGSAELPAVTDFPKLPKLKKPEKKKKPKTHKPFSIDKLQLTDVAMNLTTADGALPPIHSVKINSMTCEDFKSQWALFYLFFRSNAEASINERPLSVSVEDRHPFGKRTRWKAENLPLASFHGQGGFFDMLETGTATIDVTDDWEISDHLEVDLDWRFTFNDLKVTEKTENIILKTVAGYVNAAEQPIEIGFNLKLDPETFEGSSSETTRELLAAVSNGLVTAVAKKVAVPPKQLEDLPGKAVDGLKGFLDRVRKKPEQKE